MAGLPKKYAKMGFKKGWRAFKASKRKGKSSRKRVTRKRKYKRLSKPMALFGAKRKRKSVTRRKRRSTAKKIINVKIGGAKMARRRKRRRLLPTRRTIQTQLIKSLYSVGGGIGSNLFTGAIPVENEILKNALLMLTGIVVSGLSFKQLPYLDYTGVAMTGVGTSKMLKEIFGDTIPWLSGDNGYLTRKQILNAYGSGAISQDAAEALLDDRSAMGAPASFAGVHDDLDYSFLTSDDAV